MTVRAILERWEQLAATEREAASVLAPTMNDLVALAERVAQALQRDEAVEAPRRTS